MSDLSPASRRAYATDEKDFRACCASQHQPVLPASIDGVIGYLQTLHKRGLSFSTIQRRMSAISSLHTRHGLVSPTRSPRVAAAVRDIKATMGETVQSKAPIRADLLQRLLAPWFSGALHRSEIAALLVSDLTTTRQGYRVLIRKTGAEIAIPHGAHVCPVKAVRAWLRASGIRQGRLFRSFDLRGQMTDHIEDDSVSRIIKGYIKKVGLDPANYSGHSMRSGFIQSALDAGASLDRLITVTRHKSLDGLRPYARRRANPFADHPGAPFL